MSLNGKAQVEYASLSGKIHTIVIDKTLSVSGACADAKATGEAIDKVAQEALTQISTESPYSVVVGGENKKLTDTGTAKEDSVLVGYPNKMPEFKSLAEFMNKAGALQVETGKYTGNGNYGEYNKNTITCTKGTPVMLFIASQSVGAFLNIAAGLGVVHESTYGQFVKCSVDGKTVSWWSTTNASQQLNTNNIEYTWTALVV